MREIKFREFINGKFHYWGFVEEGIFKGPLTPSLTRGIHQQFTGLLDKNGDAIYEGDLVRRVNKNIMSEHSICEIRWVDCAFYLSGKYGFAHFSDAPLLEQRYRRSR